MILLLRLQSRVSEAALFCHLGCRVMLWMLHDLVIEVAESCYGGCMILLLRLQSRVSEAALFCH